MGLEPRTAPAPRSTTSARSTPRRSSTSTKALMTTPLIFENATVVTADDAFLGFVVVQDGQILEVAAAVRPSAGATSLAIC